MELQPESPARATRTTGRRQDRLGMNDTGYVDKPGWLLENDALAVDDFFDLLLSEPGLHVIRQVYHFEVDLIKHGLRPVQLVFDRADRPAQHKIGAEFLPRRIPSGLQGIVRLIAPFLADLFALAPTGYECDPLGVGEFAFEVADERLDINMLEGAIGNRPDDHDGRTAFRPRVAV